MIDELRGVPPERPHGKVVEAERNATAADGRVRASRPGRGGRERRRQKDPAGDRITDG